MTQINDRSAPILESEYLPGTSPGGTQPHPGCCCALQDGFWALTRLVSSGSLFEELIIAGLTSLPLSFQSPRAVAAAATALAQLPSSRRAASSKAVCPSSDPWERRTAQVMAACLWFVRGFPGEVPEQGRVEELAVFAWGFQLVRGRDPKSTLHVWPQASCALSMPQCPTTRTSLEGPGVACVAECFSLLFSVATCLPASRRANSSGERGAVCG